MIDKGLSMIPVPIQIQINKNLTKALKVVAKILPFPKPTLFSGPDSSIEMCESIALMDNKKILVVTDAMLLKLGVLDNILATFDKHGVGYTVFDGVKPDPTFDQVQAGLSLLKKDRCNAVLAVGGGSSIDTAKMVAALATNEKPILKLSGFFKIFHPILPLYAIPTTAGTGSEVSVGAVVSDPKTHQKFAFMDPKLIPQIAALDGKLMLGLPPMGTAATGMDALTHAIEAYISKMATDDTDDYAIAAVKLIMHNLPIAVKDGKNLEARQNMALASYYAGLAFTKANLGYVHAISHNFGAYYHTPHGIGNAIVLPYVLDYSRDAVEDQLAHLADVSGLKTGSETKRQLSKKLIEHIRSMLDDFGISQKLEALKEEDIPGIAKAALKEAHFTYAVPKHMSQAACESLIRKMSP